jgi:hypothetical protein
VVQMLGLWTHSRRHCGILEPEPNHGVVWCEFDSIDDFSGRVVQGSDFQVRRRVFGSG